MKMLEKIVMRLLWHVCVLVYGGRGCFEKERRCHGFGKFVKPEGRIIELPENAENDVDFVNAHSQGPHDLRRV